MGTRRSKHNKGRKPRYKDNQLKKRRSWLSNRNPSTADRPVKLFIKESGAPEEPQGNFRIVDEIRGLRPRDLRSLNSDDVYDAFKALRWGWTDGKPVHSCGSEHVYEYASRNIFKCARCGKQFSLTSKTLFHARKLPYKEILTALSHSIHEPMNPHLLSQEMEINWRTANNLVKAFRLFSGNIQVSKVSSRWPYLISDPKTDFEHLMVKVSRSLPANLPEQIRADVGQELVLGLVAESFDLAALEKQVIKYIRLHNLTTEFNKFRDLSLNQPVPGTDKMLWDEVLTEEGQFSDWLYSAAPSEHIKLVFDGEIRAKQKRHHERGELWSYDETRELYDSE